MSQFAPKTFLISYRFRFRFEWKKILKITIYIFLNTPLLIAWSMISLGHVVWSDHILSIDVHVEMVLRNSPNLTSVLRNKVGWFLFLALDTACWRCPVCLPIFHLFSFFVKYYLSYLWLPCPFCISSPLHRFWMAFTGFSGNLFLFIISFCRNLTVKKPIIHPNSHPFLCFLNFRFILI